MNGGGDDGGRDGGEIEEEYKNKKIKKSEFNEKHTHTEEGDWLTDWMTGF